MYYKKSITIIGKRLVKQVSLSSEAVMPHFEESEYGRRFIAPASEMEYKMYWRGVFAKTISLPWRYHPRYSTMHIYNRSQRKHGMK